MKITRVKIYKADMPLKEPFHIALGTIRMAKNVFIEIDTDGGLIGFGEASPFPQLVGETQATDVAAACDLSRILIGKDPLDIEARLRDLVRYLPHNKTIISAYDMALYDLLGKAADLPLYALFAGGKRTLITDRTVSVDSPEKMVKDALAFKDRGFPAVKIKLGTTPKDDIERVCRIREALGPQTPLRIDANQGWNCTSALETLRAIEDQGIQYCEQPVPIWDIESMQTVASNTTIPIMADESLFDEHDALKLVSVRVCDYLNIKLAKSGGIHVALKINAIAEAAGVECMVGCMNETRLGLTAAAHVASARPNIRFVDLDSADFQTIDPVKGGITYGDGGKVTLPDAPGLGSAIDPSFLNKLETFVVK